MKHVRLIRYIVGQEPVNNIDVPPLRYSLCVNYSGNKCQQTYLIPKGSSFMTRCSGQNENEDDLKTRTPSVLNIRDRLTDSERKPADTRF